MDYFTQKETISAPCSKQACPVGVGTPSSSERQHSTSDHKGAYQSNKALLKSDYSSNVYLQISQSIHISKIVPKFRSLQDTAKQARSYGSNSGNTVCRKGCCLYVRNTDVSKKFWEDFSSENTQTITKHTNPCDKMWIQRSQQFRISTGGTKVESQPHDAFQGKH